MERARMTSKKIVSAISALVAIAGAVFALAGPINLVTEGPFGWHIRQPAFWQGGIELVVLAALIGTALYLLEGWYRVLVVLVICELYARLQGIDLAIVVSLLYYESIAALGMLILKHLGKVELSHTEKCLFGIMLGTLTWSCVEWILSAVGPGSVRDLQIAALVILGPSLLLTRRLPVLGYVFSRVGKRNVTGALLGTFVCTLVLMLFAKASVSIDYDSLWYGVRGDRVLVAAGSVFKGLGLVSPVHYGPQAYELLLIPLSGLGSVTAILGFSIWCWVGLGICLYSITERLQLGPKARLAAVALSLATPAVMNIAITAKGDVMAATWVFFAVYAVVRYMASRDWPWLLIGFGTALAATTLRMSILVYAGLTGLFALSMLVLRAFRNEPEARRASEVGTGIWLWLAGGALLLFVLVTARTMLLTGIPFSEVSTLVNLAGRVGLHTQFPVGGPAPVYAALNADLASLIFDFIFRPAKLPHVIIGWTGGAFAYFLLVGFVFRSSQSKQGQSTSIFWLLAITFPLLLFFLRYPIRGGDGNYFIVPILSMVLMGVGMAQHSFSRKDALGCALNCVSGLFVVSMVTVSLVTGSWGPGTRPWDFDFSRPALDHTERASSGLSASRLQPIARYLHGLPPDARMVGIVPVDPNNPFPGPWLPVRYESLINIWNAHPDFLHSASSIDAFLLQDEIQYVMLPRHPASFEALIHSTETALKNMQTRSLAAPVLYSSDFVLWKLKD